MEGKKEIQVACKLSQSATFKNICFCRILILKTSNSFSVCTAYVVLCSVWLLKSVENSNSTVGKKKRREINSLN